MGGLGNPQGAKMPSSVQHHFGHRQAHIREPRLVAEGSLGPPAHQLLPPVSTPAHCIQDLDRQKDGQQGSLHGTCLGLKAPLLSILLPVQILDRAGRWMDLMLP